MLGDVNINPPVLPSLVPDFIVRIFIRLALAASLRDSDSGKVDVNAQRKLDYVKGTQRVGACHLACLELLKG